MKKIFNILKNVIIAIISLKSEKAATIVEKTIDELEPSIKGKEVTIRDIKTGRYIKKTIY